MLVEVAKKIATVIEKQAEIDPERLADAIQVAILKAWDRQVRNFLVELYEKVRLWRTEKPSYWEYQQVIQMLRDYFGGEGLVSLIRRPVVQLAIFGYQKGKGETLEEVKGPGVDISLNQTDRYALRVLEKYTTFWLKKRQDEFVDKVMVEELRKYYELGLTWDELAQNLEARLKDKWRRNRKAYFKTVARHWANQTRQMGRVSGYEEAGIKYVRVVAVLDSHTTQICRTMHGRIIPVKALVRQRDAVLDVMNRKGGVKALQQVHKLWTEKEFEAYLKRKRNLSTDSLVKDGIVMPPYHFNCRTRTVAWQGIVDPVLKDLGESIQKTKRPPNWIMAERREKAQINTSWREFRKVLESYTPEEISAGIDEILKLAHKGLLNFAHKSSLENHFKKHGKYFGVNTVEEYLKLAQKTILNARNYGNIYIVKRRGNFPGIDLMCLDFKNRSVVFTSLLPLENTPNYPYIKTFHKMSGKERKLKREIRRILKYGYVPVVEHEFILKVSSTSDSNGFIIFAWLQKLTEQMSS